MIKPPEIHSEKNRLETLQSYDILDTLPEDTFDGITLIASEICQTPIALISLVDEKRQWFKAKVGLEASETSREISFCGHAVASTLPIFEVPNTKLDERFADNPLVTGTPKIEFYAGAPLVAANGERLGTLCVIDTKARELSDTQKNALTALAKQVITLLELRQISSQNRRLRLQEQDARAEIEAERTLLDQVFVNSPAAMAIWTGPDLVFARVNPDYQRIFPGRQLLGRPLLEACPELKGQGFDTLLFNVISTGQPCSGREVLAKIEVEPGRLEDRYYTYSYIPIFNREGKAFGVYDHAVDVTDIVVTRKELETARIAADEANIAKSQFLANMSHEIRSPLGAIMGFSDLALQGDPNDERVDNYLEVIQRNSAQVLRIVDDILDLAKVEAGRVIIEELDINFISFLADFASLMRFRARDNGIKFVLEAESELPDHVLIDPTRVRQVLTNAVGNAIKFTAQGSVTLKVCYADGFLKFGVIDTGRGISPEQETNLFRPFIQADASTTRRFGGTGLGLVLTRKLCQQMGGDYTLKCSELGVGSHFVATIKIDLPAAVRFLNKDTIEFKSDYQRPSLTPSSLSLEGLKVLVVEDSPDNQDLLQIILENHGATFSLAEDGLEGVQKAISGDHDLVLMDVQMPKLDGHEAVRRMRAQGLKIPVVALTAHAMKEEYQRAMQSGFTDYLTKPINRNDLVSTILQLTRHASDRDAPLNRNGEVLRYGNQRASFNPAI